MKNILIFIILSLPLVLFAQAQAQTEEKIRKHTLGLYIGGASSLGDFGSQDITNENAGLAEGGVILGILYQYKFDDNLAFTADYGGIAHNFNAQAFASAVASQSMTNTIVLSDPYAFGYLNIGIKAVTGDKFRAYINPSIGLSSFIAPEITINSIVFGNTITQTVQESDPSASINLNVGFGGEVQLSPLISLNLDFDYFTSKHEYDQVIETFDANGAPTLEILEIEQTYKSFNTSVGLNFSF